MNRHWKLSVAAVAVMSLLLPTLSAAAAVVSHTGTSHAVASNSVASNIVAPNVVASNAVSSHVVTANALRAAVVDAASNADGDRETLRRLLQREEVRAIAGAHGLDLRSAETAVASLDGAELAGLADRADQLDRALAGGDTLVIGATTLVIILLIVLILIAAD